MSQARPLVATLLLALGALLLGGACGQPPPPRPRPTGEPAPSASTSAEPLWIRNMP